MKIEFKNHTEEIDENGSLCDVIKVDGQLYVHISKVKDLGKLKEENERLNNIIENTIKKCEYLLENNEIEINNKKYYKQKCDDIITNFIYEELKGSDKE